MEKLDFKEFAKRYCETQDCTPSKLLGILASQKLHYQPRCFILCQCVVLDSSRLGSQVILPVGPNNTLKEIPEVPFSPRGLASDMSSVVGVLDASEIPDLIN